MCQPCTGLKISFFRLFIFALVLYSLCKNKRSICTYLSDIGMTMNISDMEGSLCENCTDSYDDYYDPNQRNCSENRTFCEGFQEFHKSSCTFLTYDEHLLIITAKFWLEGVVQVN